MERDPTEASDDPLPDHVAERVARVRADVAMLCRLFDSGIEVDGAAVLTEGATWVIYGRTTYDGELILAEYDDEDEAAAVLRSMPER